MANTSATGGYLAPAGTPALADAALEDLLQGVVAGITGLPGAMVRPRWQPTNPKVPEPNVDWCAIGIMRTTPDAGPAIIHDGAGDGSDQYQRHQELVLLASFYGPNAQGYGQILSDGLSIPQNMETLRVNGFGLIEVGDMTPAPDLVNQQWVHRYDMRIRLRRQIVRTYPILNILSADTNPITG